MQFFLFIKVWIRYDGVLLSQKHQARYRMEFSIVQKRSDKSEQRISECVLGTCSLGVTCILSKLCMNMAVPKPKRYKYCSHGCGVWPQGAHSVITERKEIRTVFMSFPVSPCVSTHHGSTKWSNYRINSAHFAVFLLYLSIIPSKVQFPRMAVWWLPVTKKRHWSLMLLAAVLWFSKHLRPVSFLVRSPLFRKLSTSQFTSKSDSPAQ